ncbi:MAG TPA: DUF2076 domain-containing protein [Nitrobacter sp.]|jgi:hypothetical protein|nr:DUF2076 domain-containing protein [Nitrobacter sp.]
MTPQERQLIDDLFSRLASAENAPRDPAAMAAIADGLRQAPNAVYALVQSVLVQDEALKRAHDRIQQLESAAAGTPAPSGGFLDSMRDTMFGRTAPHGSVPSVQPPPPPSSRPVWNSGQALQQAEPPGRYDQAPPNQPYGAPQAPAGGGSFLGTAAATAAGVIGGGLLMSSIRSMMGGGHSSAFGDAGGLGGLGGARSPWGGGDQSGSSLARDAGVNDIGSQQADGFGPSQFDQAQADADQDQDQDQDDDDEMDMDSDGGDNDDGGSDYA